jgi:hypothetical protein
MSREELEAHRQPGPFGPPREPGGNFPDWLPGPEWMSGPDTLLGMPGREADASHYVEVPIDVAREAHEHYFDRVLCGPGPAEKRVEEAVALLKRLRASSQPREQQVYAEMVSLLFSDYGQDFDPDYWTYSNEDLHTAALLFGALVQHSLVTRETLFEFCRAVLDLISEPPGTEMCKFGATALESFRSRLPEWGSFCSFLYAVPHLADVLPDVALFLETIPAVTGSAPATVAKRRKVMASPSTPSASTAAECLADRFLASTALEAVDHCDSMGDLSGDEGPPFKRLKHVRSEAGRARQKLNKKLRKKRKRAAEAAAPSAPQTAR